MPADNPDIDPHIGIQHFRHDSTDDGRSALGNNIHAIPTGHQSVCQKCYSIVVFGFSVDIVINNFMAYGLG